MTKRADLAESAKTDKAACILMDLYNYNLQPSRYPEIVKLSESRVEFELQVAL